LPSPALCYCLTGEASAAWINVWCIIVQNKWSNPPIAFTCVVQQCNKWNDMLRVFVCFMHLCNNWSDALRAFMCVCNCVISEVICCVPSCEVCSNVTSEMMLHAFICVMQLCNKWSDPLHAFMCGMQQCKKWSDPLRAFMCVTTCATSEEIRHVPSQKILLWTTVKFLGTISWNPNLKVFPRSQ
jgi:hypothetical protein